MQLQIQFPKVTFEFFAQNGANFAVFDLTEVVAEDFGPLKPGKKYLQIGTKRRTQFTWTQPAEYNGTITKDGTRYILFNSSPYRKAHCAYAFPVIEKSAVPMVLHFKNRMNGCRDIVIDGFR